MNCFSKRGTMSEADATAGFQRVVSAFEVNNFEPKYFIP